ncbi:MAG TPA: Gmad2 immunoglobulin-like domain-containing protein [Bacilli bacterium]|nr:Gmad2 immunoglobulin-like domain-containing protein [Bacilli bacterium]
MSKNKSNKTALWLVLVLVAAGIGGVVGYQYAGHQQAVVAPTTDTDPKPTPEPDKPTTDPQPEPADSNDPEPKPQDPAPQPSDNAITFRAFGGGSGSLAVDTATYTNNSFQIERIEWSEASGTIYVTGKMRAFEAVGYMRVRDENNMLLEPESIIRAREGAPAWSGIKGEIPLKKDYEGRVLYVEFFVKSMNDGTRTDILRVPIKPI